MKDKLVTTMGAILRQNYLEKIERYLGKDTIVILTGFWLLKNLIWVFSVKFPTLTEKLSARDGKRFR